MEKVTPEDFSVDMRTILAKERTIMSSQRLQLNLIGIGLGLFATGFTLLKIFESKDSAFVFVEAAFILGGTILSSMAVLEYFYLAKELRTFETIEMEFVHSFKSQSANQIVTPMLVKKKN